MSDERYICFEVLFDELHPPPPVHAGMKLFGGSVTAARFSSLDSGNGGKCHWNYGASGCGVATTVSGSEHGSPFYFCPFCGGEIVHPDDDGEGAESLTSES